MLITLKNTNSCVFLLLFTPLLLKAQPAEFRILRKDYIETFKDEAIKEMHRVGIPASITLAQGILESGDGNSVLAKYANNHFGIKCHNNWNGETFFMDDDEKNECFRKYESAYESYKDHSDFLTSRQRYAELFELKITDYKGWANGLKKAGYATNPKYADLLIKLIEDYNLYQFDTFGKAPHKEFVHKKEHKEKSITTVGIHNISIKNRIKSTICKSADTPEKIAKEFDMAPWQIYRYNDINRGEPLTSGQVIYLQPKRNKAEIDSYTVLQNENMWEISQKHGVKLKKLYKYNNMVRGTQPKTGQVLKLQKRK
ncbi:MAG: glucosaminidase domain-containing protein [Flavobacteriales bacterium]|nr:glucosaminidase domain-containing protein [Flavobacteriales bacterium]